MNALTRHREKAKWRAIHFVQLWSQPRAVLQDTSAVLEMPDHSHERLTIVQFDRAGHGSVAVGQYTSINDTAEVLVDGDHHLEWVSTYPFHGRGEVSGDATGETTSKGPVVIGSDVVIGWRAVIQAGVTIGHGAVVGACALVTKDVEPYSIVGGVPAQVLRYRFDAPTRAALLRIAWWDWPHDKIVAEVAVLQSADLEGFIARYDTAPPE